jgi:molybdopterin-guanine dinucleotide biosynthesis protein
MARAKSQLRPCGIASGPVVVSGHPNLWEFALGLPKTGIAEKIARRVRRHGLRPAIIRNSLHAGQRSQLDSALSESVCLVLADRRSWLLSKRNHRSEDSL